MIAGVDGCKKGWVVAMAAKARPARQAELFPARDFTAVMDITTDCAAVAVDMPIGLPDDGTRVCDLLARKRLTAMGKGIVNPHSRVFSVPPRAVVEARGDHQASSDLCRILTGKKITRQTHAILPKIREADAVMTPILQRRVVEAHPELCFAHLAGRTLHSKHSIAGVLERAQILRLDGAALSGLLLRGGLPASLAGDVLDALVCLHAARHAAASDDADAPDPHRLPEARPPRDARGLRMEIWF